ncbi:MAG: hypothetical protein P857_997 [Candidatus Xenolissoclinum pacificiensis L6]|uniref:Uncharacterized protein n=1 Tax=Candidatus Xenolissoclinum pacificiensis L6 TaxID=1401685 RepID=W2V0N9_9RICK|nr:MAG: hypothetical protein P857_997 [Candidatus Xenolissoclinum pacificiensis L6]
MRRSYTIINSFKIYKSHKNTNIFLPFLRINSKTLNHDKNTQ